MCRCKTLSRADGQFFLFFCVQRQRYHTLESNFKVCDNFSKQGGSSCRLLKGFLTYKEDKLWSALQIIDQCARKAAQDGNETVEKLL